MNLTELQALCLKETKSRIRNAITLDQSIIQLVGSIEDIDATLGKFLKRLRDWFELYGPEESKEAEGEILIKVARKIPKTQMGRSAQKEEWASIQVLVDQVELFVATKNKQLEHLERLMQEILPNTTAIAGSLIAGKLLRQAGSFKHLAGMPASTIQVLGAEKALFRHMRSGAKPPKYGILFSHPYVAEAKDKGKHARTLADKIALAARVDYFKGEFIADKLKESLI